VQVTLEPGDGGIAEQAATEFVGPERAQDRTLKRQIADQVYELPVCIGEFGFAVRECREAQVAKIRDARFGDSDADIDVV
jgi:hypothetical protein